jgi:hypothetical protein
MAASFLRHHAGLNSRGRLRWLLEPAQVGERLPRGRRVKSRRTVGRIAITRRISRGIRKRKKGKEP